MKWVVGTGSSPFFYLGAALIMLLMEHFLHASPETVIITLFGGLVTAELARIRDEIRKFNE
jgi:hypothetical protein